LVLHLNIKTNIAHWRIVVLGFHVLEHGWLVLEALRGKRLGMMHLERVETGEMRMLELLHVVRRKTRHAVRLMASLKSMVRSWHGQRSAQPEDTRSVEVSCLGMEQGVRTAGSRRVVTRQLVGKAVESVTIRIQHRRGQSGAEVPDIASTTGCLVQIFDALLVGILSVEILVDNHRM